MTIPALFFAYFDVSRAILSQPFTSKEYLERALQPAPGFTEQIEAKNRIRRMLTHFFPERDCFTMVIFIENYYTPGSYWSL